MGCCKCCKKKGGNNGSGQQQQAGQEQRKGRGCCGCCKKSKCCKSKCCKSKVCKSKCCGKDGCCKKCCSSCKKCKCCSLYCWANWIVIIVGVVLLLMYTLWKCEIYRLLTTTEDDVIIYWLTFTAILFPTVSALVFMIFTKCGCKCCCCWLWLAIWLLIHLGFSTYVAYANNYDHLHTSDQIKEELNKSMRAGGQFPKWFQNTQRRNACCGVDNYDEFDDALFPRALLSNCPMNTSALAPSVKTGCKPYLDHYYHECLVDSITFVLIMMVLGVVPMVVYVRSYRDKERVQAIQEANKRWLERRQRRSRSKEQDDVNANSPDESATPVPSRKDLAIDLQQDEGEDDFGTASNTPRSRSHSPHYKHRNPYDV